MTAQTRAPGGKKMSNADQQLSQIELERVVSLAEASRLSSLSQDNLKRNHRDKIVQLSERRQGMRVKHALMLDCAPNK
jgi:hypothetical protein